MARITLSAPAFADFGVTEPGEIITQLHPSAATTRRAPRSRSTSRYATHLIAMSEGQIVARGDPAQIVDAQLVERVFGLRCRVIEDPETGTPLIVPAGRGARAQYPSRTTFSSGSPAA